MQRHRTDAVSLVLGVILLGIGTLFASGQVDASKFLSVWALPIALLAAGIVLGAMAFTRYRRDDTGDTL